MLDQWLEQCGVSFRKASLIQDKKTREGPDCLPVCSFIKRGLTETSQLGLFFHPTQWRATLFAKVSAPGAGPRSQSLWTKREIERGRERMTVDKEKRKSNTTGCHKWMVLKALRLHGPPCGYKLAEGRAGLSHVNCIHINSFLLYSIFALTSIILEKLS